MKKLQQCYGKLVKQFHVNTCLKINILASFNIFNTPNTVHIIMFTKHKRKFQSIATHNPFHANTDSQFFDCWLNLTDG